MPLLGSIVFEGKLLPASAMYGCFMTMSGSYSLNTDLPENFRVSSCMLFNMVIFPILLRDSFCVKISLKAREKLKKVLSNGVNFRTAVRILHFVVFDANSSQRYSNTFVPPCYKYYFSRECSYKSLQRNNNFLSCSANFAKKNCYVTMYILRDNRHPPPPPLSLSLSGKIAGDPLEL